MKLGFVLSETWHGLRRNLSMAISIILVTTVSMLLLGLGLLVHERVGSLKGYWFDRVQVSIFLCPANSTQPNCVGGGVTEAQKNAILTQLHQMPEVRSVFYESEQQAYSRFKEQFRDSPVLSENLKVGDIPQSYRVQLKDPTKYAIVASQFDGAPGVASVQDQSKVLKNFFDLLDVLSRFAWIVAAVMVLCAALLMMTTIRQVAYTRRREIGIMRLVGASNSTIRTPFVLEVLFAGVLGVPLALGLLWAFSHYILSRGLNQLFTDRKIVGDMAVWATAPWMLGAVIVLAVTSSMITLWRYLRV